MTSRSQSSEAQQTTDHDIIRKWTEERGGKPATVKATEYLGADSIVLCEVEGETMAIRQPGFCQLHAGDKIGLGWQDRHAGILRIDFDPPDQGLERIGWDEFFEKFDEADIAFLHQDRTKDGQLSRFHKFVHR